MSSLRQQFAHEPDFYDFDSLDSALEDQATERDVFIDDDFDSLNSALEDEIAERDEFADVVWDDDTPYRSKRVIAYAGSPGVMVACPRCNITGRRVDEQGGYTCDYCGYTNLQERPPRAKRRR